MALLTSTDNRKQQREIYKTIEIKLWLEDRMSADLRSEFKKISKDFASYYNHYGTVINLDNYNIDLISCMRKWYRKTADIFSKNIRLDIKENSDLLEYKDDNLNNTAEEKNKINAEIAAALLLFIENQSKKQAKYIIDTSKSIIDETIVIIKKRLEESGMVADKATIADLVRKEFNNRSIARSELIAKQEIGLMASESKEIEALALNKSNEAEILIGTISLSLHGTMYKTWNAELDMKTRPAHAQADFRYKYEPIKVGEYFIVDRESLKYPRDPAGSIGNIINCRCEALYITKAEK